MNESNFVDNPSLSQVTGDVFIPPSPTLPPAHLGKVQIRKDVGQPGRGGPQF
jgi:hypothetical protein